MDRTETKIAYAYAIDGKLVGKKILDYTDRSPMSGAWQLPAQTTETKPPNEKDNYDLYFKNGAWQYVEQAQSMNEATTEPSQQIQQRYLNIDSTSLDLAQAILELSDRIEKLEGGNK